LILEVIRDMTGSQRKNPRLKHHAEGAVEKVGGDLDRLKKKKKKTRQRDNCNREMAA